MNIETDPKTTLEIVRAITGRGYKVSFLIDLEDETCRLRCRAFILSSFISFDRTISIDGPDIETALYSGLSGLLEDMTREENLCPSKQ